MEKIKSFFVKTGQWFKKTFSAFGKWCAKTATKVWKWALANKVTAGIIAGAAVLAITTAIVVPVSISAAKRKSANQEPPAQQEGSGGSGEGSSDSHNHTYSTTWSINDSAHWHASTCGHDVKQDEANHTFGEWAIKPDDEGREIRTCTVCGYAEEQDHTHKYAEGDNWSSNGTQHWHAATCGHNVKKDEANHTFGDWAENPDDDDYDIRTCSVCGYVDVRDHEHVYSTDWEYDYLDHWHEATCSHTTEVDEFDEHIIATTKIGTYSDGYGSEYDVYKDTCDCGLIAYKIYDVDTDSTYYEYVSAFTAPTESAAGSITFYPDCKQYSTTLSIPKLGANRVIDYEYLFVDRAYDLLTKGKQCYARVNPWAYSRMPLDDDNFYMAIALSQDPAWEFEISDATYDASRHVDYGVWTYEPWYGTGGTFRLVYKEGGSVDISVPAINVEGEWSSVTYTQGDYSDGYKLFVPEEDASFFSLIDDIYLREQAREYLCYDDAGLVYDFKKANCATYCGLAMSGYSEWDDDDEVMVVVADICYGKLNTGDTLYYYTDFYSNGLGKGTPLTVTVDKIYQYNGEEASPTSVTPPVYGVGAGSYVLLLKGTGLGTAAEDYFGEEGHDLYLSTGGKTQLEHIYSEMYGIS